MPWPLSSYATPDFDDLELETGYDGMKAYTRSKTANLVWSYELARRLDGTGITVSAVNPGGADTQLQQEAQAAAPLPMRVMGIVMRPLMGRFMDMSLESAAYSSVYAATAPEFAGMTGVYLGPKGNPDSSSSVSQNEGLATELWDIASDLTDVESYGVPAGITTDEASA